MEYLEQSTDQELILRIRQGESELADYLMEKYKDLVIKKTRALYLIGGEADDLIQEGMIGLFKAVRDYDPEKEAAFSTFANLCVERQLYTAIQNSMRQKHMPLNSYISLNNEQDGSIQELIMENPEAMVIDRENADSLNQQILKILSPLENKVLDQYLKGFSYTQIAEELERTPKSIDNALHRIRAKIREWLEHKNHN
ncbi:MAG: RNA polymerase sporulation sigma factor SigH [Clostridiales bacterium]|nr:RNA polymerase sporulation sigma factor SigH [Candidatus Blautia equi]